MAVKNPAGSVIFYLRICRVLLANHMPSNMWRTKKGILVYMELGNIELVDMACWLSLSFLQKR